MKEKRAASAATDTAQRENALTGGSFPVSSIAQTVKPVNPGRTRADQLRFLHRKAPAAEIVRTVQAISPRFGKVELSKAENDTYGIEIGARELRAVWMKVDPEGYAKHQRRKDGHLMTKRLSCRVSEKFYSSVKDFCKNEGKTINEMLIDILAEYFGGEPL